MTAGTTTHLNSDRQIAASLVKMVSAHLWYDVNRAKDVRAFECTLMVPADSDPLQSYFMAVGFHRGYFGMQVKCPVSLQSVTRATPQVNEPTVRRFLFSVWDTHDGVDKVEEVSAHPHAVVRPFGGEGTGTHSWCSELLTTFKSTGLQSFLHYRWQPDTEYSFRVEAQPEEDSTVVQQTLTTFSNSPYRFIPGRYG